MTDNTSKCENGHLKRKIPQSSVATLGFKSLVC